MIDYDNEISAYSSVVYPGKDENGKIVDVPEDGIINPEWASATNLTKEGEIITLVFDKTAEFSNSTTISLHIKEINEFKDDIVVETKYSTNDLMLVYVDLAGNNIAEVDLDSYISNASIKSLKELYLDTNAENCTFANAYRITDFNVEKLSLANVQVGKTEKLPYRYPASVLQRTTDTRRRKSVNLFSVIHIGPLARTEICKTD